MAKIQIGFTDQRLSDFEEVHPQSIKKFIPEWFRSIKNTEAVTVKSCPSFIDVFKEGFVVVAPQDYLLRYNEEDNSYQWSSATVFEIMSAGADQVGNHTNPQFVDYLPKESQIKFVFKLHLPFLIFTDKGYSTRIMKLPYQFNDQWECNYGVLKSDLIHQVNIQINVLKADQDILIEKGTPLCLIVPFKREEHKLETVDVRKKEFQKRINQAWFKTSTKFNHQYFLNKFHKE